MRFAICDDDRYQLQQLEAYFLSRKDLTIEIEPYENGKELLEDIRNNQRLYDAIFLDMEMPEMDGLETARRIRENDHNVIIVFVTSYEQFAIDGYEYGALRYLVKPVSEEKLNQTVDAIVEKYNDDRKTISVNMNKEWINIELSEILYFEKRGHYIDIHTKTDIYHVRKTMAQLEEEIKNGPFCRAKRGLMVNIINVKCVKHDTIYLKESDEQLPLSQTDRKNFIDKVFKQKFKEMGR